MHRNPSSNIRRQKNGQLEPPTKRINKRKNIKGLSYKIQKGNGHRTIQISIDKKTLAEDKIIQDNGIFCEMTCSKINIGINYGIDRRLLNNYIILFSKLNIDFSLFGNKDPSKEITEVAAGIKQIRRFNIPGKVRCYIIGEGKFPVISTILSRLTDWNIVSMDPILDCNYTIERVQLLKLHDYDVDLSDHVNFDSIVIVGIHSHNDMTNFCRNITKPKLVILIQCCMPLPIIDSDYELIEEEGILSGKNMVHVWNDNFELKR